MQFSIRPWMMAATLAVGLLGMGAAPAAAQTYNLAESYSSVNTADSPFKLGEAPTRGGAFTEFTAHQNPGSFGLDTWSNQSLPAVLYNPNTSAIMFFGVTVPGETVAWHPGPAGQNAVVRFTAPTTSSYLVNASFAGRDAAYPTTTDVAILHGGSTLFSGLINSYNVPLSYSGTVSLAAGQTLDFTLGYGSNNHYYGDTTGLDLVITREETVSAVPEPASLALMLPGLGAVALLKRRKKNV